MAMLPCDRGPHSHRERNVNTYFRLGSGSDFAHATRRYCPAHWGDIHQHLAQYEVVVEDGAESIWGRDGACVTCGKPINDGAIQLFVTSYPSKNERKDYWLSFHGGHAPGEPDSPY